MKTSELFYDLPIEQIAQKPVEPRENAKLLHYQRSQNICEHLHVSDLVSLLKPNDCLVLNVTSVLRARLLGVHAKTQNPREIFLLRKVSTDDKSCTWEVLIKGKVRLGDEILFKDVAAKVERINQDGTFVVSFPLKENNFINFAQSNGHVPVPPYIHTEPQKGEYETVYADPNERRSAAAPTAGFHLTNAVLDELKLKGVQIEKVILDVGLGTFQPIRTENLEDHQIHSERIYVGSETAERINTAKEEGKRIVAVGTTTLRVLESVAGEDGKLKPYSGETKLFITPGYKFKIVDALLTNFHLPESSLLALVSAFIGSVDKTLNIYNEAVAKKYRFFSFGDAMLIE